jgi:hypothetical protein
MMNNFGEVSSNYNKSVFFEEVKNNKVTGATMTELMMSPSANNQKGVSNFGCGTNVLTVEKDINARVDMKDMGS